jgi:hypothetical protein
MISHYTLQGAPSARAARIAARGVGALRFNRDPDTMQPHHVKERSMLILRYEGKVPVMASCAKCERKFFLPTTFSRDAIEAEAYLGQRFAAHRCEEPMR